MECCLRHTQTVVWWSEWVSLHALKRERSSVKLLWVEIKWANKLVAIDSASKSFELSCKYISSSLEIEIADWKIFQLNFFSLSSLSSSSSSIIDGGWGEASNEKWRGKKGQIHISLDRDSNLWKFPFFGTEQWSSSFIHISPSSSERERERVLGTVRAVENISRWFHNSDLWIKWWQ